MSINFYLFYTLIYPNTMICMYYIISKLKIGETFYLSYTFLFFDPSRIFLFASPKTSLSDIIHNFKSGYSKPFNRFPKVITTSPNCISLISSLYELSISLSLKVFTSLSPLALVPDNIKVLYPLFFFSLISSIK